MHEGFCKFFHKINILRFVIKNKFNIEVTKLPFYTNATTTNESATLYIGGDKIHSEASREKS